MKKFFLASILTVYGTAFGMEPPVDNSALVEGILLTTAQLGSLLDTLTNEHILVLHDQVDSAQSRLEALALDQFKAELQDARRLLTQYTHHYNDALSELTKLQEELGEFKSLIEPNKEFIVEQFIRANEEIDRIREEIDRIRIDLDALTKRVEKLEEIAGTQGHEPVGSDARKADCPICLESIPAHQAKQLSCGHIYCKPCLLGLIKNAMKERDPLGKLLCPDPTCKRQLSQEDIHSLVPNVKERNNLEDRMLEQALARDPHAKHCPTANCPFMYLYEGDDRAQAITCPKCHHRYCPNCQKAHDEAIRCNEVDIKLLQDWQRQHDAQQCPNCRMLIEKSIGCNHMTCKNCKHEFCWVCSRNYRLPGGLTHVCH